MTRFLLGFPTFFHIFDIAEKTAALALQILKCALSVFSRTHSSAASEITRAWLADVVPQWYSFRIAPAGEYLGIMIGVNSSSIQWVKPLQGLVNEAANIARPDELSGFFQAPVF